MRNISFLFHVYCRSSSTYATTDLVIWLYLVYGYLLWQLFVEYLQAIGLGSVMLNLTTASVTPVLAKVDDVAFGHAFQGLRKEAQRNVHHFVTQAFKDGNDFLIPIQVFIIIFLWLLIRPNAPPLDDGPKGRFATSSH